MPNVHCCGGRGAGSKRAGGVPSSTPDVRCGGAVEGGCSINPNLYGGGCDAILAVPCHPELLYTANSGPR